MDYRIKALAVAGLAASAPGPASTLAASAQDGVHLQRTEPASDIVGQLAAATEVAQVNDIIAAAAANAAPAQIALLVRAAIASHPGFALSVVSAAAAAHPEAAADIASAAVDALPTGQQAALAPLVVSGAALAAKVPIPAVATAVAARNATVGDVAALVRNAASVDTASLASAQSDRPTASTTPFGGETGSAARDTLATAFTPVAGASATTATPLAASPNPAAATTAAEPPSSDPSKGNSGSPT